MPNWSYNSLILEGSKSDLDKFYIENISDEIRDGKKEELSFNKSVPRPESEESNWYNWNCANWGSKWDACYISCDKNKKYYKKNITNTLLVLNRKLEIKVNPIIPIVQELFSYYVYTYNFDSAWAPPFPWLEKVSLLYSDIKFEIEFSIEGHDEGGRVVIKNGDILTSEKWSISEKIYEDNKDIIRKIVNDYIRENEIIYKDLSLDEKSETESLILNLLHDEGYWISDDKLSLILN
jgi:hypothetical protein